MATTSTAPVVRQKLVDLIDDAVDTRVSYCHPPEPKMEEIYFGDTRDSRDVIPVMQGPTARRKREEQYTLVAVVDVVKAGGEDGGHLCEARAFELFGAIEDALANDPQVGLGQENPTIRVTIGKWSSTLHPDGQGWKCQVACEITVKNRLS